MEQYRIGNNTALAWVERILALNPQVKRAKELEDFVERLHSLFNAGEPLNVTARRRTEAFFGYDLEAVRVHHGHEAEEVSRRLGARAFTFRGHIFGPRQNLDTSSEEGLGLLAHELTHAIQQIQPHQLPQRQRESRERSPVSAASPGSRSDVDKVLLASPQNPPLNISPQKAEAQAQASERLVTKVLKSQAKSPPQIDPAEVASRVYRLMEYDLKLERDRLS